jgi:hypothetical protein
VFPNHGSSFDSKDTPRHDHPLSVNFSSLFAPKVRPLATNLGKATKLQYFYFYFLQPLREVFDLLPDLEETLLADLIEQKSFPKSIVVISIAFVRSRI